MEHLLSFDIEEHFQVAAFDCPARRRNWNSFHSRVDRNTQVILDLLEACNVKSTMFILGWVAERHQGLVKRIAQAGHEVACHGFAHELITMQSPERFREDVRRAKGVLEDCIGRPVLGYRAPTFSVTKETIWALPILVEEGFYYDSSIVPAVHDSYGILNATPKIHSLETQAGPIWEVPPSTCKVAWTRVPVGGGGYFRLFPYRVLRGLLRKVEREGLRLVMYFHPWEFDPEQPKMRGSWLSGFRHYLNLGKTHRRMRALLQDFSFAPIHTALPDRTMALNHGGSVPLVHTHEAPEVFTNLS